MDILLFVIVTALVIYLIFLLRSGGVMGEYWRRPCTGRAWKRAFPEADKVVIRDFLTAFVDGFAFSPKQRLCFLPTDRVMDIYNCVKGPTWDDMELEFFDLEIEARFGRSLESFWHDGITLGEVFSKVALPNLPTTT